MTFELLFTIKQFFKRLEYPVSFPSAPQRLFTSGVTVKQGKINLPCPSYASRTPHPNVPSRLTALSQGGRSTR